MPPRRASTPQIATSTRSATTTPGVPPPSPWRAASAKARRLDVSVRVKSATQSLPGRIDEARRAHLDLDHAVAHRIGRPHALAVALRSARQKAEPDPVVERGRERDRG